jgi:DNA-binding transcriptional LysR family regulator
MLNFELRRTFVAVADCDGFHRAAEQRGLGVVDWIPLTRRL